MRTTRQSHIDGQWLDPADARSIDVIDPSTARSYAQLRIGDAADVDRAVGAAKQAFDTYSRWPVDERVALLRRVLDIYQRRYEEVARTISQEMGAPIAFARAMQAAVGTAHLEQTIRALQSFRFSTQTDSLLVSHEPIGVCALITPWNWPINQIVCKVAPALAAGCTMVLKPSEIAPFSAILFAEILHEAGVPPGVFNPCTATGTKWATRCRATRMSTWCRSRADARRCRGREGGRRYREARAPGSAARAEPDPARCRYRGRGHAWRAAASATAASRAMRRRACSCMPIIWRWPSRPRGGSGTHGRRRSAFDGNRYRAGGQPHAVRPYPALHPARDRGGRDARRRRAGAAGRAGEGFYVRPTVFSNVTPDMTIAREEIFGPVLSIMTYRTEEEAIALANDSVYEPRPTCSRRISSVRAGWRRGCGSATSTSTTRHGIRPRRSAATSARATAAVCGVRPRRVSGDEGHDGVCVSNRTMRRPPG